MRSLRARLIAGLLGLAAAGLLVLGGVTYIQQRRFQLERVDEQARNALPLAGRALDEQGIVVPGGRPRPFDRFGGPGPGPRRRFGPDDGPVDVLLPGTFIQRRGPGGRPVGQAILGYGQTAGPTPDLPAELPLDEPVTVDADGGSGYRALARRDPSGVGTLVVAVPLREVDQRLRSLLLVEALVIAAVLLVLGALASLLVRLGLRPLDRMGDTAGAIAAGDLTRRVEPATSRTEVGRLGLALNAMLARLEQAFAERRASEERLRRFLADASHELRTPLASIRGYAELFRMGAASDPAGSARAMARIEQEAARMGVLVEDLLTLARLDRVRDPVRDPVDLVALAHDAVDDARATAPARPIALHAPDPVEVLGDADGLRQVAANLLRNALVHTPPEAAIEVTVAQEGQRVRLEVRDHGPGLPPGDPQALFERFWRAEGGRERGRAGAGLGLAIVAAIVAAHGGEVRAADASGGGARFEVELPAGPPGPREEPRRAGAARPAGGAA